MIETIITFAKQRAKTYKSNFPVLAYTLSEFINLIHERYSLKKEISFIESVYILTSIISNTRLKHFYYLKSKSDTIKQMADFFIKLKKNDIKIDYFKFPKNKEYDLKVLFEKYNDFLIKNNLSDLADIEKEVIKIVSNQNFSNLILDEFKYEKIKFITSKKQDEIYNILKKKTKPLEIEIKNNNAKQSKIEAFNNFDEVKSALKKVRDLISDGVNIEDIKIVASDIVEYQLIFETLTNEYGLKGYTSIGVPLKNLLPLINGESENLLLKKAKKIFFSLKIEAENISKRLKRYNINNTTEEILENLVENTYIKDPTKIGIELLETNQVFGYFHIPHLIFIGCDIEHFPPKKSNNIFYTVYDDVNLFYANSLYESSISIYKYMKNISENLYIIHSKYRQKTPLSISFIIDKNIKTEKLITKVDYELLKENKRVKIENMEKYLEALKKQDKSEFDGKDVGKFEVKHLSASTLNLYLKCPRKYFYSKILRIRPPETEYDEIEDVVKGDIMHKCFEKFAKALKDKEFYLNDEDLERKMYDIAKNIYQEIIKDKNLSENIYYKIFFEQLTKGLVNKSEKAGILKNFIEYLKEFKIDFKNSRVEKDFFLDNELNIITSNDNCFIKGKIDRIDINENLIEIFDYKLKKVSGKDTKKLNEIENKEDVQLALYLYYANKEYPNKNIKASLISFNTSEDTNKTHIEFAILANFEVPKPKNSKGKHYVKYNDEYENELIEKIYEVKGRISNGDFEWNNMDEDFCNWCEYKLICKKNAAQQ